MLELNLMFHFLRGPQTQRSGCCVCQQRTRVWNRTWALPKASCSSCRPSRPSPVPCSSRWNAPAQQRAHRCATKVAISNFKHKYLSLTLFYMLCQENENLRSRVQQLEMSLQQRAEQLSQLERQSEQSDWRRGEELRKREDRVRELQLELDKERGKEPVVKVSLIWKGYWNRVWKE